MFKAKDFIDSPGPLTSADIANKKVKALLEDRENLFNALEYAVSLIVGISKKIDVESLSKLNQLCQKVSDFDND